MTPGWGGITGGAGELGGPSRSKRAPEIQAVRLGVREIARVGRPELGPSAF
jgi:hypothetical protein